MNVPFVNLKHEYKILQKELDSAAQKIISDGTFILGKPVEEFEEEISKFIGTNALGCASGSDALLLALMASGIKPEDEVITSPFTFFATAGAVSRIGAVPVFVDIDPDTYNIDPSLIEDKVTDKTKAIIPVHVYGQIADMDPILEIAKKHNLSVIEDAAQAIGASYKGRNAGTIGDFACFSFFPTKNLGGCGDGGLITCTSKKHYDHLKKLRVHGAKVKYFHDEVGINSRLDALQATLLNVKLAHLENWNKKRQEIAKRYDEELPESVKKPTVAPDCIHIYHQYAIQVEDRDGLLEHIREKEIGAAVYYPLPLHLQKCFSDLGYSKGDLPNSEKTCDHILSIPIHPHLSDEEIDYVVKVIGDWAN